MHLSVNGFSETQGAKCRKKELESIKKAVKNMSARMKMLNAMRIKILEYQEC